MPTLSRITSKFLSHNNKSLSYGNLKINMNDNSSDSQLSLSSTRKIFTQSRDVVITVYPAYYIHKSAFLQSRVTRSTQRTRLSQQRLRVETCRECVMPTLLSCSSGRLERIMSRQQFTRSCSESLVMTRDE